MSSFPDLLRPIAGPNPSGEDTRYTGIYDQISEARREDPDLPQVIGKINAKPPIGARSLASAPTLY